MYQVIKRDGKIVDFNLEKISQAISLAFEACEKNFVPQIIDFLALKVTADFGKQAIQPDTTRWFFECQK